MTPSAVILDDQLLLRAMLDGDVIGSERPIYTTGLWYHRLARAIADEQVRGVMTRLMDDADRSSALGAIAALTTFPDEIGLVSLRDLAWPMAALAAEGVRLNVLALEALAAAVYLEADLHLVEEGHNPRLAAAALDRGIRVHLIAEAV